MAIRIVCDICGKDAGQTKYVVPVYNKEVLRSKLYGANPRKEDEVMVGEVNLCSRHKFELAKFLSVIQ